MFLTLYEVSTVVNWLIGYLKCLKVVPQVHQGLKVVPQCLKVVPQVPQSAASSASKCCLKCLSASMRHKVICIFRKYSL